MTLYDDLSLVSTFRNQVPSTSKLLKAQEGPCGRGVTIAFLDSGFYPHPDIADRIVHYRDFSGETVDLNPDKSRNGWNWHGMQTSVVACGNGSLSEGRNYRGLASEANLVLLKVSRGGRICDDLILKGLKWIKDNRVIHSKGKDYTINILNISVGSDFDPRELACEISVAAENLVEQGILVLAAAGNDGGLPRPPANAPTVLTVGGCVPTPRQEVELYHSNHGIIAGLVVKPEVIAPAAMVAAPLMPGSVQYKRADYIYDLAQNINLGLLKLLTQAPDKLELSSTFHRAGKNIPAQIQAALDKDKIVGRHYQHVDGTSFASPIVASVAAQMLEVDPSLTPTAIRQILMSTADRVNGRDIIAQGCGVVNAVKAVEHARQKWDYGTICELRPPLLNNGKLSFVYFNSEANEVEFLSDINHWTPGVHKFQEEFPGLWTLEIDAPSPGLYAYRFRVNKSLWFNDPTNIYTENNPFGTSNSLISVT